MTLNELLLRGYTHIRLPEWPPGTVAVLKEQRHDGRRLPVVLMRPEVCDMTPPGSGKRRDWEGDKNGPMLDPLA